jgi:WD40 repeat protein/uncharacterized membrane protein
VEGGLVVPRANKPPAPVTDIRPAAETAPRAAPETPDTPVEIRCPNCDAPYNVPAKVLGKKTHCKQCKTQFVIERAAAGDSDPQLEVVSEQAEGWADAGRVSTRPREQAPSPQPPAGEEPSRKRRKKRGRRGGSGNWVARNRVVAWVLGLVVMPASMLFCLCGGVIYSLWPSANKSQQGGAEVADTRPDLEPKDVVGLYLLDKNPKCFVVVSPGGNIRVLDPGRIVNGGDEGSYTIKGHHLLIHFTFTPIINEVTFGDKPVVEIDGNKLIHPEVGTFIRRPPPWLEDGQKAAPPVVELEGNGPMGTASLLVLNRMAGQPVRGVGLSADGSTVVGGTSVRPGQHRRPYRWSKRGGYVDLGWPEENTFGSGAGLATSADGSLVAGEAVLPSTKAAEAVRFSSLGTQQLRSRKDSAPGPGIHVTFTGAANGSAFAISADGSVLAGVVASPRGMEAFRWTEPGGMVLLGVPAASNPNNQSRAHGISADGNVVVGSYGALNSLNMPGLERGAFAFRWTKDGGMKQLAAGQGLKNFTPSGGQAASADGKVVVGVGLFPEAQTMRYAAFRWTEEENAVPLDDLPSGSNSYAAQAVSADGSIAAGWSGQPGRAVVWDTKTGLHDLQVALPRDYGLKLDRWKLQAVRAVSADGRTFMGTGVAAEDAESHDPIDTVQTWVVTLHPSGDALFSKEAWKPKPFPEQAPATETVPPKQLARVALPDVRLTDDFADKVLISLAMRCQVSSDGRLMATGSANGAVKIWQLNTGKELASFKSGLASIWGVALSPDGRLVATRGEVEGKPESCTIKVWDWEAGKEVASLDQGVNMTKAVFHQFSPDGKFLVTINEEDGVNLWDMSTWKEQTANGARIHSTSTIAVPVRPPMHAAFSGDGSLLAVGHNYGLLSVIDVRSGKERVRIDGVANQFGYGCLAISHDGKTLATKGNTSSGSDVFLWDVARGELHAALKMGHGRVVESLAFSPDDKSLAVGEDDDTVSLWDVETGKEIAKSRVWDGNFGLARATFLPDGKLLITFAEATDKVPFVLFKHWTATISSEAPPAPKEEKAAPRPAAPAAATPAPASAPKADVSATTRPTGGQAAEPLLLKGHANPVTSLAFTPDGKTLATAGNDGEVKVWEVAGGKEQASFGRGSFEIFALAISPDGRLLAMAGGEGARTSRRGTVRILEAASGKEVAKLEGHAARVRCVAFAPDGKTLATGSFDGAVKLWDVGAAKETHHLAHPEERVASLAFSADGSLVAFGFDSGGLQLCDVATGSERRAMKASTGNVLTLAFAPDGKTLAATNARDSSISLWEVAGGESRTVLRGPAGKIVSLSFSPDGKVLATGGVDGTVRLWDAATGKVRTAVAHEPGSTVVTFAPDGKLLTATAGKDGSVKLWKTQVAPE